MRDTWPHTFTFCLCFYFFRYVHICLSVHAPVCTCMWKPEVALHLIFESLTEHRTLQSGNMTWPVSPRHPPVSASSGAGVAGACHHTRVFSVCAGGLNECPLLLQQVLYRLSFLPSPTHYYPFASLCEHRAHVCKHICMYACTCMFLGMVAQG